MTSPSEQPPVLRIRLLRGALLCLVRAPGAPRAAAPQFAFVASARQPHLRRWRLYPGWRPSDRFGRVPHRG